MVHETMAGVLKILIHVLNRNRSGLHSGFSPSSSKYNKLELQILILEAQKLALESANRSIFISYLLGIPIPSTRSSIMMSNIGKIENVTFKNLFCIRSFHEMKTQRILLADPLFSRIATFDQRVHTRNLTTITILLYRDICFEYLIWEIRRRKNW